MRKNQRKLNNSGIELAAPRLTGRKPSAAAGFCLSAILILLGVFGAAWCFVSAFSVPILSFTAVIYSLIFVVILVTVWHLGRMRFFLLLTFAALYAGAGYYLRAELVQGFLITTNQIMVTYARHSDYVLPIYDVSAKPANFSILCTIFVVYAVFLVTFFLSWAIVKRQSLSLVFFATLPFPLAALVFNITPNFYAVLMLITCWATLLFMRLAGGKEQISLKRRGSYRAVNPAAASKAGLQLLPVVILCFALILSIFPQQTYQYSGKAAELRDKLTDTVSNLSLFDGGQALAGSTDHVNLKGADSVRFTGRTMLQVQATEEYPTYLKGFTGSVYTNTSWEPLPDSDYQEINRKLNGLNVQNMSSTLFNLIGQTQDMDLAPFGIHVKNVGANKKCIYAPYNLTTTPQNITGVKFVNDEVIRSGWIFGTGDYSLYANSFKGQHIRSDIPDVFMSLAAKIKFSSRNSRNQFSRAAAGYVQSQRNFNPLNADNLKAYYTSTLPDNALNAFAEDEKNFLQAEQDYRLFMYDKYTQLPQDSKEKIQGLLRQKGLMGGDIIQEGDTVHSTVKTYSSVDEMVNAVKNYLARTSSYTLTPGKTPPGRNFIDYFLFENHKGYCVHFATAATVMLRAMGVPARYAEGYIVTADDYKNAVGGWANVKDNRAHAWVEVYYPGLGWQPIEMTPGFNVAANQAQDDEPQSSSSVSSAPPESTAQSSASSIAQSAAPSTPQSAASRATVQPPSKRSDDVKAAMMPILLTIAFIGLSLAAAVLKRRVATKRRRKLFAQQDGNKAAIAIYDYMVKLTRFGGEISEAVTDIALKARFSQHTVSAEELKTMRDTAELLAQRNVFNASTIEEILIKYVYNLA